MLACTALLGDFTVGPGDGGDGGSDVSAGDATDANDAATLFQLACTEGAQSNRIQVTQMDSLNADLIRIAVMPTTQLRVALANYVQSDAGMNNYFLELEAYTVDVHNQNQIAHASLPTAGYQALAMERYGDNGGGFAVLYIQSIQDMDGGVANTLWVAQIPDGDATWSTPVQVAQVGTTNNGSVEADFTVINSATNDYFIAYSLVDSMNQTIFGGEVVGMNSNPLTKLQAFPVMSANQNVFDVVRPGVAYRANVGYVLLSPSGNNGPPPVGSPMALLQAPGGPVTIMPAPTLNYFPVAFGNAVDPAKVNTAILIANLNTLTGQYGVGQVAASGLGSLDPTKLPATIPTAADGGLPSLKDLFVGGGSPSAHWEIQNLVEQFLITQPTTDPLTQAFLGGVSFAWWDAPSGSLRAYAAGDGNVLGDIPFPNNADATITLLVGSIAQIEVAYEAAASMPTHGSPPVASDLWLAPIACVKK